MLVVQGFMPAEPPEVELDPYTPVTVTWARYGQTLDPPQYARCRQGRNYLELKFHPEAGDLLEAVLVSAADAIVAAGPLGQPADTPGCVVPLIEKGHRGAETPYLRVIVHDDALDLQIDDAAVERWVGSPRISFGLAGNEALCRIVISWSSEERRDFLDQLGLS
jgi:hypothetical protein